MSSFTRAVASLVVLGLLFGGSMSAQAQDRTTVAALSTDSELTVDGRLDEPAWAEARPATGFRQLEPTQGEPASQETEVRVLYGSEAIYVGGMLYDEAPSRIMATLGRRDQFNRADWFTVSFDSNNNQETAYTFAVNAAGIQADGLRTGESGGPGPDIDTAWDAIWTSEVRRSEEGWIAELRIPYSQLRFSEGADRWRVHFRRRIPRAAEESEWPLVPQSERQNILAQYGVLTNMEGADARRNVQVRPYVMSSMSMVESGAEPGTSVRTTTADLGGDVKVGLSSNVTLDATVNPDFGQVEADPAQLNLTAFETFFEERRPFFLEGVEIYEFPLGEGGGPQGGSNLLYTRRIGAAAPIVGAAKLSGRTAGGTSFGALAATTGRDFSPNRAYGVGRIQQQFADYSSVGGIVTGFEGPARATGRKTSLTGGTGWDLRFSDNRYGLSGFAAFTHRQWTTDRANRTGFGAQLQGSKRRGTWSYTLGTTLFDGEFDPNDLGRQRRNNYVRLGGNANYQINDGRAFGPFQNAFIGLNGGQRWSYEEGVNQGFEYMSFSNWTLRSFRHLGLNLGGEYWLGGYDLYETRGLGPAAQLGEYEVAFEYGTDQRRDWEVEMGPEVTFVEDGARVYGLELEGEWAAADRLSFELEGAAEWERGVRAWSSNDVFRPSDQGDWAISTRPGAPDELGPGDYQPVAGAGRLDAIFADVEPHPGADAYYRPVYGSRNTREMDVTLRSNFTLTPDLSLELYSQVFVARGRYEDFRVLTDRDTYERFGDYPKRDEFTLQSFQLNSVLRWEYRPGSTLFLVWTQSRRADRQLNPLADPSRSVYDQPLGEQFTDTFGLFPNNTLLVKLEYTFLR